jgi:hypothetical protein
LPAYHAIAVHDLYDDGVDLAKARSPQLRSGRRILRPMREARQTSHRPFGSTDRAGQKEACWLRARFGGNYRLPGAGGAEARKCPRTGSSAPIGTCATQCISAVSFHDRLALTFWSWFALILLATHAACVHRCVLRDEHRLGRQLADLVRKLHGTTHMSAA